MADSQRCPQCDALSPPGIASCAHCGFTFEGAAPRVLRGIVLSVSSELPPQTWELPVGSILIGRLDSADVILPHPSVSRQHARISASDNVVVVEDLRSKNGTWIDDRAVAEPTPLQDGETLLIGDVLLRVELAFETQAPAPAAQSAATGAGSARGSSTVLIGLEDALPPVLLGKQAEMSAEPQASVPPVPRPADIRSDIDFAADDPPTIVAPTPVDPIVAYDRHGALAPPANAALVEPAEHGLERQATAAEHGLERQATAADHNLERLAAAADQMASELRALRTELSTAVWLFEHAGGGAAVQAFVEQVNATHANPQDLDALRALIDQTPAAARLLQASLMLFNALLPVRSENAADGHEQTQAHVTELQPVAGL